MYGELKSDYVKRAAIYKGQRNDMKAELCKAEDYINILEKRNNKYVYVCFASGFLVGCTLMVYLYIIADIVYRLTV